MSILDLFRSWLQALVYGFFGSTSGLRFHHGIQQSQSIDIWEAIDIASSALERIAGVSAGLSLSPISRDRAHNDLLRELSSELLILAHSLGEQQAELTSLELQSLLVQRVQRILLDVERIFSVRPQMTLQSYADLRDSGNGHLVEQIRFHAFKQSQRRGQAQLNIGPRGNK